MVADTSGSVRFSIGRVIGDSIGIYARNFVGFSFLALLIGLIYLLVAMYDLSQVPLEESAAPSLSGTGGNMLARMLVNVLTQAAIIYGTFQDLRGNKAGIADCIARGLASVIPVIVGSILLIIGVGLASLLLLIPGIIVALMWWVYVPVIVVERKGIFESFGRSRELTNGRRWSIFGLAIIIVVLTGVVGAIVNLIAVAAVSGSSDPAFFFTIADYVLNAIITAFGAVLVAVGYYYLRVEKEGIDVNDIASVFD
ncbi:MAG TPA: hypothetical protein VGF43_12295 [Dongiaceae bacterium]|jgi:hypothetical protein